ncbi:uncharacterized protein NECHADRAFT_84980 [Fusarium vanettenii 77-13-4]|uniref:Extracellular membrane protein CFEM domain-containing protein n=1 Tax=Fusarium vanettenii (strain ATCC MYA-4622 / CBS 123669 / FGSC 9596 / NRRL 45880 / 77-13-4) TaxID=660122 RepID=C7YUN1_FUSV7|nr:uncharacterized protein NECHADRAFT_84980 [Fusarium vanettenii 77-13-4]EEU44438.1 hypothetical protein NECHADRAFT_84980 [Fusarium vanettenii 77-13-4]
MQLTYTAVILGSLASLASATVKRELPFPDSVPLHKRQPSGPEYQCHANCGYTILNADEEGYCDSDEWKKLLADCLKCANQYDMWGDYGNGVTGAAKACGIDAVPEGAASGSATGSSAVAATTVVTSVTSAAATSAEVTSAEETTAAAETTSAAAASSTAAETAATTAESSADANTTPGAAPTTTENDNSASNLALSGVLAVGAALVAAAGLL